MNKITTKYLPGTDASSKAAATASAFFMYGSLDRSESMPYAIDVIIDPFMLGELFQ
jgi:hypothetical protein